MHPARDVLHRKPPASCLLPAERLASVVKVNAAAPVSSSSILHGTSTAAPCCFQQLRGLLHALLEQPLCSTLTHLIHLIDVPLIHLIPPIHPPCPPALPSPPSN